MAKARETFGKKEKEKKRLQQRQEKHEKMEERKANAVKKSLNDMMAYVDENGNLSSTPPDPRNKKLFKVEDMNTGVPTPVEEDPIRQGIITFFSDEKGYGFIKDLKNQESVFVHISNLSEPLKENTKVTFETAPGPRGLTAVNVKKSS